MIWRKEMLASCIWVEQSEKKWILTNPFFQSLTALNMLNMSPFKKDSLYSMLNFIKYFKVGYVYFIVLFCTFTDTWRLCRRGSFLTLFLLPWVPRGFFFSIETAPTPETAQEKPLAPRACFSCQCNVNIGNKLVKKTYSGIPMNYLKYCTLTIALFLGLDILRGQSF